jgi:hypothetical protein
MSSQKEGKQQKVRVRQEVTERLLSAIQHVTSKNYQDLLVLLNDKKITRQQLVFHD